MEFSGEVEACGENRNPTGRWQRVLGPLGRTEPGGWEC